jgi:hypothetical protein
MAIYRSNVKTPVGQFILAVDTTASDARADTITAAVAEFRCHAGQLRVDEPQRSNRRIVADMWPVKACQSGGEQWAWIIR